MPLLHWELGRFIKIFPEKDHVIRVVELKVSSGIMRLPVSRMAILPASSPGPQDVDLFVKRSNDKQKKKLNKKMTLNLFFVFASLYSFYYSCYKDSVCYLVDVRI